MIWDTNCGYEQDLPSFLQPIRKPCIKQCGDQPNGLRSCREKVDLVDCEAV